MGDGFVSVECKGWKGETIALRATVSMSLKAGDKVIARLGRLLKRNGIYDTDAWVITEAEAEALLATGKFRFAD